jgi:hypothetical protein
MVGAGAVVTHAVPPYAVMTGNPARLQGFVMIPGSEGPATPGHTPAASLTDVHGIELVRVPLIQDSCGSSAVREEAIALPFSPARWVVLSDVASGPGGGKHAYRRCAQVLVCLRGSVMVLCDDGRTRQEVLLDDRRLGLHLAPMVWSSQHRFSREALLLVLASHPDDPGDEIREYDQFRAERRRYAAATPGQDSP